MEAILIPVKRLDGAKQRLSTHLTPGERVQLGLAMLGDILAETWRWQTRFLLTGDSQASELGRSFGVETVPEQEADLNSALALGTTHAVSRGVRRLLVLPADVPAVMESDLLALFEFSEHVVVAPSSDGGTTAILRSPPDVMGTAFGASSARAHMEAARLAGVQVRKVELGSLLLDVDDYADLGRLADMPLDRESVNLARKLAHPAFPNRRSRTATGTLGPPARSKGGRLGAPDGPDSHP